MSTIPTCLVPFNKLTRVSFSSNFTLRRSWKSKHWVSVLKLHSQQFAEPGLKVYLISLQIPSRIIPICQQSQHQKLSTSDDQFRFSETLRTGWCPMQTVHALQSLASLPLFTNKLRVYIHQCLLVLHVVGLSGRLHSSWGVLMKSTCWTVQLNPRPLENDKVDFPQSPNPTSGVHFHSTTCWVRHFTLHTLCPI
jgi:hypothetical protein